jgi:hypothetical protein
MDFSSHLKHVAGQVPAIVLICMFHLMTAIPFGVSYFPVGWSGADNVLQAGGNDGTY